MLGLRELTNAINQYHEKTGRLIACIAERRLLRFRHRCEWRMGAGKGLFLSEGGAGGLASKVTGQPWEVGLDMIYRAAPLPGQAAE